MDEDPYHHRRLDVSPLFVGLLGVMAGAVIVATFHCLVVGWCSNNQGQTPPPPTTRPIQRRTIQTDSNRDNTPSSSSTSNSTVQLIPAYNYSEEFKEGICAVCLSEFMEGDEVRILPQCGHLFHVPCIDMWLYSHFNCPLCRAQTMPPPEHIVVSLPDSGDIPQPELDRVLESGG